MIKTFTTENFRCFKKLEARDLRRINVLVGKNAAGKTSFLESLKLGLDGTPNVVPWLNNLRGVPFLIQQNSTNEQFQGSFQDFFHDFDAQSTISTDITDYFGKTASLRLRFDPSEAVTIQPSIGFRPPASGVIATPATTIVPLALERVDFSGTNSTLLITLNQQGQLQLQPGKPLSLVSGFFASSLMSAPQENATWLSSLRVAKHSDEVIEAIQRHFPFIKDVTSENANMGMSMVYVDIPSLSRKIPLSLVSGGINRLFTLILAIVTYKGGVVLIDEIENGIYYDQYRLIWQTLYDLAVHHETQLFVSSHSLECLKAMLPVLEKNEKDFRLLRITKNNGASSLEEVEGKFLESALEQNFEVR